MPRQVARQARAEVRLPFHETSSGRDRRMPEWTPDGSDPETQGITITRVFDAPRELVFKAWTEPERFARWFGPSDAEVPPSTVSMDVRPGGAWRATMFAGPGRHEIRWKGVYREVVAPGRLVFTISDQPSGEHEVVTVILTDLGDDKTEMQFHQVGGHLPPEEYPRAKHGWSVFFERMAELLAEA
jgi:uncharacterized protein YndB with AHSA1/START domain